MRDLDDRPDPQFRDRLWAHLELEAFGTDGRQTALAAAPRRLPRRALLLSTAAAVAALLVATGILQNGGNARSGLDVARIPPVEVPTTATSAPRPVPALLGTPGGSSPLQGPMPSSSVPQELTPVRAAAPVAVDRPGPRVHVDELLFTYRANPADRIGIPFDLGRMALDGSGEVAVVTAGTDGNHVTPAWAPDGRRIVYASRNRDAHDHVQLYIREADGTERRLTDDPCEQRESMSCGDADPDWSPTGDLIAFGRGYNYAGCRREIDDCGTVMLVPASGGTPIALTRGFAASWSPDGQRLVFADTADAVSEASCDGTTGCSTELFVINRDGTGRAALGIRGAEPAWSPDGRRIAYVDADGAVRTVSIRGTDSQVITVPGHTGPTWSPDGRTIVTAKMTGDQWDLWATDHDGAASTQITRTPAIELSPAFRPRLRS